MDDLYNKKSQYDNILNRIKKNISIKEGFFLIIKQYLTNNICYYFLCILVRFIPLIILSGNYHEAFHSFKHKDHTENEDDNNDEEHIHHSASEWISQITVHKLLSILNINEKIYMYISFLIFILFIIRIILYIYIINGLRNKEITYKWPMPSIYQVVMDHIAFLLFPYILEYLSFIYYIFFNIDNFIIKTNNINRVILIIILITNTLLIIGYNINNYIYLISSNKIYTTTWHDAYEAMNDEKYTKLDKPIKFEYTKPVLYLILLLQNLSLFQTIGIYINNKTLNKIIISSVLSFILIILFFLTLHKYNYTTFINILINILTFYCFYSLVFDFLIYILEHIISDNITEIIYVLVKLLVSFLSYISIRDKVNAKYFFENINEILFEEKNKKRNENILINCLLYLNELMSKIKEENENHSAYLLITFFNKHINNCHKVLCNCKILNIFLQKELNEYKVKPGDKMGILDDTKGHIPDIMAILNYLYESIFIEYDYYNKYHLSIILAEHYCHLKKNPTMAFSLVSTLLLKKKEKLNLEELITLYELSQKYIYFISAQEKYSLYKDLRSNKINSLIIQQKEEYFKLYFITFQMAYKLKKAICTYVDNELKILKFKSVFEEAIDFKYDENNEEIVKVDIKFFREESNLKKMFTENELKKLKKLNSSFLSCSSNNNLFQIISLLKNEQYIYNKIINSIEKIKIFKGLPTLLVFKYYLFFDLFEGGKIPQKISNKLKMAITNYDSLYTNNITPSTYSLLIKKLKKQNYMNNSKYYIIFQYKDEFRIKYFNEVCALILGYKLKDLINEKIDVLMPREFCKSHQNMIKKFLVYEQLKYFTPEKGYFFDINGTKLFTTRMEGILIYELYKYLMFIVEISFTNDNEYRFMLNSNFELLAHNTNFENEYSLNYNICQYFNLNIMDIFKIKPKKIYKEFSELFKVIHYQKYLRKAKVEEYFTPQLYVPNGDKNTGMMNPIFFNNIKNNIFSKIVGNNKENKKLSEKLVEKEEDEIDKLIDQEKSQNIINDFIFEKGQIKFQNILKISLKKRKFIENLSKELSKIPDNDLMFEGDKISYNLIITSKNLVQNLLSKKELINNVLEVQVKLSYYYDKPYYFVSAYDKKKLHLKLNKTDILLNNSNSTSSFKFTKRHIKNSAKFLSLKNKITKKQKNSTTNLNEIKEKNTPGKILIHPLNNINVNNNNSIDHYEYLGADKMIEKMEKYIKVINSDNFIKIIKYILTIICICVIIIYIIIMDYQKGIIDLIHKTFQCYYYNLYTKNLILHFQTVIIEKFCNISNISNNNFSTEEDYRYMITELTPLLKENFHYFTNLYYDFNLEINHDFKLMFRRRTFKKLFGYWEEVSYLSDYPTEMDSVIYNVYYTLDLNEKEIESDINNFIFRYGIENRDNKIKINSNYIKIIYYFIVNYELTWKDVFQEIDETIMDSFTNYVDIKMKKYYAFEVIGLILIIIFYLIAAIYLYFSNEIIIKNIIFLFLDFSEEKLKTLKNNSTKVMMIKLIEFQNCINDFNLEQLNIYVKNLENIQQNQHSLSFMKTFSVINSTLNKIDSLSSDYKSANSNHNDKKEILSIKNIEGGLSKKDSLKDQSQYFIKDELSSMSNSSINYLTRSNSTFLKEKLNNNNNNNNNNNFSNLISNSNQTSTISNNIGTTNNQFINSSISKHTSNKTNKLYKKSKNGSHNNINQNKILNNDNESLQDIILKKSNKTYIILIKIYTVIIYTILILITIYSIFKLINTINFHNNFENIFYVFNIITNRYSLLNYYYNTLKSLIIFPMEEQKKSLDNFMVHFEELNEKYEKVINKQLNNLNAIKDLFDLIKDSKRNSTELMYNSLCIENEICIRYLYSSYNILDVGIDFLLKSTLIDISKIYMDYMSLKDNKDIQKLKELIIDNKFIDSGLFIEYAYYFIKYAIFEGFKDDEVKFKNRFKNNMKYLNLITLIFAVFSFFYVVIFVFITINIFGEPIKRSAYRISCSFYYIKKYNIFNYRKSTTH